MQVSAFQNCVLIVGDETLFAGGDQARPKGLALSWAANADDALRACRAGNVACLVLAHGVARAFDSWSFLDRLRAETPGFDAPIIVLSDEQPPLGQAAETVIGRSGVAGDLLAFAIAKAIEAHAARRAASESDLRFQAFMGALAGGAWIKSLDGTFVYVNPTMAMSMNRPVGEIVGHRTEEFMPPDLAAQRRDQDLRAIEGGATVVGFQTVTLAGHPRHMMMSAFPIRDAQGVISAVGGIGLDMSGMGNIVADAPVAVAMIDKDLRYVTISKRWAEEFGGGAGAFSGRSVDEAPPAMPERWRWIQKEVLSGATLKEDCDLWPRPDGTPQWYRWAAYAYTDQTRLPAGILVSVENVTAQKLARDEQGEVERRYRMFFDNAAFGAAETALDGQILKVNKCLCDMSGYAAEELIGKMASDFVPPEERPRFLASRAAYVADRNTAPNYVMPFCRKDGRVISIRITPTLVRNEQGVPLYSCGIFEDISEYVKAEAALRESEQRYRAFFDDAAFGAIEFDLNGQLTKVNRRLCEMGGFSAEELIGKRASQLTHPDDQAQFLVGVFAYLSQPSEAFRRPVRFFRKDGSLIWVLIRATLIRDADGSPRYACGIVEDVTERIAAESALRESEQRHRIFFDSAAFGAAELDLDGRFLKVNKCLCDMGGYTEDELLGRKASEFALPEDHATYLKARADHYAGKPDGMLRGARFRHKDGSYRWIRITPSLIRDENGAPLYSAGIVEDITESIQAAEALRESEERLRHLIDNIPNSALYKFTRDDQGYPRLIYLTSGVEALTGYTAEQAMANPSILLQSVLPDYRSKYVAARIKAATDLSDFFMELPIRRPNGEILWVRLHSRASREADGAIVWHGVQVDITERKLAELALARNEARLNAVLDGVHDGIVSIDSAGAIQSINAAGAAMFGYERDELIGRDIGSLCPVEPRAPADAMLGGGHSPLGRANGAGFHADGRRKDGSEFPLEVATVETRIDDAPLFVCFLRDLSERRTIEAHMELLKAQRLAAMGGMAAALAHELNQPLAAIGASVETAQRLLRMSDAQRPFKVEDILDSALGQTIRAGEIISTLRQFAARGEPDRTAQSLHALIEDVRDAMSAPTLATDRPIALRLEASRDMVFIDKVQIRQVLFNLVRNADESMEGVTAPRLTISTSLVGAATIRVDIADNGPGVAEEIRERLFEPLTTTKAKGMGIGLSLSRSIAEIHSGSLTASANAEGGATFSLTLPLIETD